MGQVIYELCNVPYLGFVVFLFNLCGIEPPIPPVAVSLDRPGIVVETSFSVSVDKSYPLWMWVTFPSNEAFMMEGVMGTPVGGSDAYLIRQGLDPSSPEVRANFGQEVPFRVLVRKLPEKNIVFDDVLYSRGYDAHINPTKIRNAGAVPLKRGDYQIEVTNLYGQPAFSGLKIELSLQGG